MQIHPVVAGVAVFAGSVRHRLPVPPSTSRPPWQPSLFLLRSTSSTSVCIAIHPPLSHVLPSFILQYRQQVKGR